MLKSIPKQAATTNPPRARARRAGFTIVEVAIASTILVLALCGTFGVLQMSFKSLDTARTSTLAAQVMQSEIERLRLLNWNVLLSMASDTPVPINIATAYSANNSTIARFSATRKISPTTGRESSMLDIQVFVTWRGLDGITYTRSFKTKYSKNGLYDYFYTARSST